MARKKRGGGRGRRGPHRRSDHFHRKAQSQGHAARSVYKLEELDRTHRLLKPGMVVVDLGCRPGSWLRYAAKRVGAGGRVVGIDRQDLPEAPPANAQVIVGDVFTVEPQALLDACGGRADVLLSDMAPDTTGIGHVDAARSAALCERALELAEEILGPGGTLLYKIFQGGDMQAVVAATRALFSRVSVEKPAASRSRSREQYVLAVGKKQADRNPG